MSDNWEKLFAWEVSGKALSIEDAEIFEEKSIPLPVHDALAEI